MSALVALVLHRSGRAAKRPCWVLPLGALVASPRRLPPAGNHPPLAGSGLPPGPSTPADETGRALRSSPASEGTEHMADPKGLYDDAETGGDAAAGGRADP